MTGILLKDEQSAQALGAESTTVPGKIVPGMIDEATGRWLVTGESSGSGGTIPTGTVNGVNVTFTSAVNPGLIFTENGWYTPNNGFTVTGSGPYTITMTIPPSIFIIVFPIS